MPALGKVSLAASLAMLAWMGRSIVTGQIPFTGDLLHFHYPLRDFYARALAANQPFDWMPGLFSGFYVVGEGQLGGYHPLHWLLYRAQPLDRAFAIELVLAYPFLWAGMWLWLRRRIDAGPAAFGAMAATFSGFMLVHGVHPNIVGVLAHVPWLLWVLDGVAARTAGRLDRRGVALIGLLLGSQLLLGHPQSVWFTALIGAAYAAHLMAASPPARWRVGFTLATGALVGVAVGAVQVLATLDAAGHSTRPTYDAEFATQYSLRPIELLQLLHPYLFWGRVARWNEVSPASDEYAVYGGGVLLTLAVWWVARQWKAARADRFGLHVAAFGLVGLWLATGSYGKLYYLQTWLPLVSQFRAPVRYTVFTQWALAVLAALAVARLVRRDREDGHRGAPDERGPLAAAWGVVVLATVSAPWLPMPGASPMAIWAGPLVLALSAALLTLAARGVGAAVVALVLVAAADQALYGLNGVIAWQDFVTRQQAIGFLDTNSFLPTAGETRLARGNYPNLYLLANHRFLDGYVAIASSRQLDYHQPNALRAAQVEYAHADFFRGAAVPEGAEPRDGGWFRLPGALPRARLVTEAPVSRSPAEEIAKVDVTRAALVTRDLALDGGAAGTARLVTDDPGDISVQVDASSRQLLVVSESFAAGWRATLDSQPVPVERVNGDFLGCVIPAGSHTVRLQFRPEHLAVGRYVSLTGLVLVLSLLWISRRTVDRRL
jgi:hypothetical protein